ncbi:ABC transporter ATP-binding protein [Candidatus Persebacteraceae bacterium Df01]|uniref:ABC transporter ATP-binding protein n=1 Tax=Candidatus Doriopsillibacter californiensis TaxID=2970740 RepID=A0ABT7QMS4_9GAMM|nr:ABC transporter ATP-binding protein [Candidatus Persebacteraceae bacterium Df01]
MNINAPMLEVRKVTKQFGGLTALNQVSFSIKKGEIRGLIGPNGAGKSTMFKNIAGFYKPTSGDILYQGQSIVGNSPYAIAESGIVRTFQETTLFSELTVHENTMIGCHKYAKINLLEAIFRLNKDKQKTARERVTEILNFMGLEERQHQLASELPLGSQRALALSIALVSKPEIILMDEPFAGMNPEETSQMMMLTRKVQQSGVTIVLVEHDMKAVMGLCDSLTVLNFGQLLAEGSPEEICNNEKVIEAYLGGAK